MFTYREFPDNEFTYHILHKTGHGVMENQYKDEGYVYATNDLELAQKRCKDFEIATNTQSEIEEGWCNNTYWIVINTLTEAGKDHFEQFKKQDDYMREYAENNPKLFDKYETKDGHIIYIKK